MKPGDLVRSVHGSEEGVVQSILPKGIVEVEIEDGFTIPFQKSDLVVISRQEHEFFEKETVQKERPEKTTSTAKTKSGIYFVVKKENEKYSYQLWNNQEIEVFITFYNHNSQEAVLSVHLLPFSFHNADLKTLEGTFNYTLLKIVTQKPIIVQQSLSLWQNDMETNLGYVPDLKINGFIRDLSNPTLVKKKSQPDEDFNQKNKLEEALNTGRKTGIKTKERQPSSIIDLHLEEITEEHVPENEILSLQLRVFENKLDQAITSNMTEITFIHGVGNGVLRMEIHKRLSKNIDIKYFEDAQKAKFGYGATKIQLK